MKFLRKVPIVEYISFNSVTLCKSALNSLNSIKLSHYFLPSYSRPIETKNPTMKGILTSKKPYQRKLCDLTIVADHTFFEEVGQNSLDKTVLQMLWHIKEANAMIQSEEKSFIFILTILIFLHVIRLYVSDFLEILS